MEHSEHFELVRGYYNRGLWNASRVRKAVADAEKKEEAKAEEPKAEEEPAVAEEPAKGDEEA